MNSQTTMMIECWNWKFSSIVFKRNANRLINGIFQKQMACISCIPRWEWPGQWRDAEKMCSHMCHVHVPTDGPVTASHQPLLPAAWWTTVWVSGESLGEPSSWIRTVNEHDWSSLSTLIHTHLQTLNTNTPFSALFLSLSLTHALIHPSLADQSIIHPAQEEGWGWGGEEDLLSTCKTIKVELITQPHLPQL